MSPIVLSGIYIYPIKSLGGVALQSSLVEERGLPYDRRWLLVDKNNQFLTQRKLSNMALIHVAIQENGLLVTAENHPALQIPFEPQTNKIVQATVWDDTCQAI